MRSFGFALLLATFLASNVVGVEPAKKLRVGMIGLDTSHVVAFTKAIKNPKYDELKGLDVVAAFPGGSPDIPASADRLEGFTKALKEMGVEIVDSIDALLPKVDAVMLESVDGRPHLAQAKPVIAAKKPLFIDKPMAASLADVLEIFRLAKASGVPVFSSSSLRFSPGIIAMRNDPKIGEVRGCDAYSPCSLEPHHPDLFWYGVHGVETLYTIMGAGCTTVTRATTPETDLVTGTWRDGRIGTFRGLRGKSGYGATVFGTKGIGPSGSYGGYEPLLVEVAKFFVSGKSPIAEEETIELFAFMAAADESKRLGGAPVSIESVIAKAKSRSSTP